MISTADHFQHLLRLLEIEGEAEKQEALRAMQRRSPEAAEATGFSLTGLVIREQDAGLGGRILLTLGKRSQTAPLPWTRLGTGAPVILSVEDAAGGAPPAARAEQGWRGIVSRLGAESIQVALNDWPEVELERATFRLDRSSDEVARQRQRQALLHASRAQVSRLAVLRAVLLGQQAPAFHPQEPLAFFDPHLNEPQREAVRFALSAADVAILHGPPGTGKTTTLVELIRQIARRGERVLAVAPSNLGVDNLLEKLIGTEVSALRLGHPARVLPELRRYTLDERVESHPEVRLARKWMREAYALRDQAGKFTRARPQPGARQAMRQEARELMADARKLEDQVVERLLDGAQVLCATTTGLDHERLGGRLYDWCIMDEASQSTEPGVWIALQYAQRLVLAGDPYQLPPTVVSPEAAAQGFAVSMMERLMAQPWLTDQPQQVSQPGAGISRRLTVQYRMHQEIMDFSSREFYEGSLVADESVRAHLLRDLPGVADAELTARPVDFIDTAGASYDEEVDPEGESRLNPQEAVLVVRQVEALLEAGVAPADIAVISPYAAQVRHLREQIRQPELEVDSVDGFQGREKEAVIVSLVRSNRDGEIGFLADVRRMNVALTRARRKLIVIGDSATITSHPFYRRLVAYFENIGAYHSVWEL